MAGGTPAHAVYSASLEMAHPMAWMPCSAVTREGILQGLTRLADDLHH
jgi:hypothetical protein